MSRLVAVGAFAMVACLPAQAQGPLLAGLSQQRAQGCAGRPGTATPLRPVAALDEAARQLARGAALDESARRAGYRGRKLVQIQLRGFDNPDAAVQAIAARYCQSLLDPELIEGGVHAEGRAWWVILAAPFRPPELAQAQDVSARVLALVNEARARPRACGASTFGAAGPLRYNPTLEAAAMAHARDMAAHGYLEHTGRDGSTPADRASRVGYAWRSIGENIASGQTQAQEVVAGWLRSPEHCANIMEPRFTEMGIAFAVNRASEGGIYWVQAFGRPR